MGCDKAAGPGCVAAERARQELPGLLALKVHHLHIYQVLMLQIRKEDGRFKYIRRFKRILLLVESYFKIRSCGNL